LLETIISVCKRIEIVQDRRDRGGIGRVEDPQVEIALAGAERPVEHVRGEAAAAHTGDTAVVKARIDDAITESFQRRDVVDCVGRASSQPSRSEIARPTSASVDHNDTSRSNSRRAHSPSRA
jgi:hypothetical protein